MPTIACSGCFAVSAAASSDRLHNARHPLTPDRPQRRALLAHRALCMLQQQSSRASEKLQRLLGSLSSTLAQRGAALPGPAAFASAPAGAGRGDQVRGSLAAMPPASQQAFLRALLKSISKDRRPGAELLPGEAVLAAPVVLPLTRSCNSRQSMNCAACAAHIFSCLACLALSLRHLHSVACTECLVCGWPSGTAVKHEQPLRDALCDAADSAAAQAEAAPKCRSLPDTIQRPKVPYSIHIACTACFLLWHDAVAFRGGSLSCETPGCQQPKGAISTPVISFLYVSCPAGGLCCMSVFLPRGRPLMCHACV